MHFRYKSVFVCLVLTIHCWYTCTAQVVTNDNESNQFQLVRVFKDDFKRMYRLNDSIYRSEQPSRKEFKKLEAFGIKTVLNFRRKKNDMKKAKGTNLKLIHMPLKTKELNENGIIAVLKVIQNSEKPLLVHCWHGSDRTGATMAAYRIIIEDWSKQNAINELRMDNLGYHENWYPNVIDLLNDLNVPSIRKQLKIKNTNP